MPTLLLSFPARRYHATPWGHHVNEGQIEWPPSPWRFLRALLATGYATLHWPAEGAPPEARSLIGKLADSPPRYRLPRGVGTHSRHYMPLARFKNGREDTTLVFDTWAQIDEGVLVVTWNVDLTQEETQLLSDLAERLGYLGRSESWVLARLAQPDESLPDGDECFPCSEGTPGRGWDQVPLMAPLSSERYEQWRSAAIDAESAAFPRMDLGKRKLSKDEKNVLVKLQKLEASYPADLIACLQTTTDWLRQLGWSQPPGSERIFYWRRSDALEVGAQIAVSKAMSASPVEIMLLSLTRSGGNSHSLPPVTRTLPQAELLHRALVSITEQHDSHSVVLTGCDALGSPLAGPHSHAHVLPLDLDSDGHLDHVLIWAPMGLGDREQTAVRAVRRTFTKGGTEPLRLALAGIGSASDLCSLPGIEGDALRLVLGTRTKSQSVSWRSLTPFVPPRYLKKRGRNTLAGQVAAELESRGLPAASEVRVIDPHGDDEARLHRHFVRRRRHGPAAPADFGFTLELQFPSPIRGPICLGYGSHFGLGVFRQIDK